ncbi:MAG: T9SS type A sorting domain-containing protein [Cyclobacteriaceae bacterium]
MKTLLLFVAVMIGVNAFAQGHEEGRQIDPAKSAQVYPNPAVDFITLKFESPIAKNAKLAFHTIIGTSIELEQEAIDDFEIRIKVKDLSAGYYIIGVNDSQSNTRGIYKFLKK